MPRGAKPKYRVNEQMRRIADDLFILIDAAKEERPDFALDCLKEARQLANTAIKNTRGAAQAAGKAVIGALEAQQQRLADARKRLEHVPAPIPVRVVRATVANNEKEDDRDVG